jgi:hypothetical protein
MTCYVQPELKQAIDQAARNDTLAACCLVFVSQLYIKAAEKDGTDRFAPLHSRLSRRIYTTRFYGRMISLLRTLSAIELYDGGSYEPGKVCKRYRLSPRFCADVQVCSVICPKLEARLDATMTASSYAAMSGVARKWILKTFKSVAFTPALAGLLQRHPFKTDESRVCIQHHVENIVAGRLRFKVCPKSGRVYYPIANLPKAFRAELLIDRDPVVEIDISASQPTLLATLYPDNCPEKSEFLAFVQGGRFYETIAAWANRGWSRDEAKTEFFNQIAFGSYYCAKKYELLVPFKARFPMLATGMARIKRLGNAVLPLRMQKLEASITVDGACGECAKRKIKVLPVHDSLICRKADAELVAKIFSSHWQKRTKIPARMKIS